MKKNYIKLWVHNFKLRTIYFIKRSIHKVISVFKSLILPCVIVSCMVAFAFIFFWIFCNEDIRVQGELALSQIEHKLNLIGVIITIISLFAAAIGILISMQKPKFKVLYVTEHGDCLNGDNRQLGVDKNNVIGYQACVPNDWKMLLYNVGDKVAEKIKIKINLDEVTFSDTGSNNGYELEDFVYGCGVFETLSLNLTDILRQGESIEIPKIPFEYAVVECPNIKEKGYINLHMRIYCNNQKPKYLRYRIKLEDYDIDEYDYSKYNHLVKQENAVGKIIQKVIDKIKMQMDDEEITIYNYLDKIEPYLLKCKSLKEFNLKEVYKFYIEKKDMEKMLFWGRMYYRSIGIKKRDIEAILQTIVISQSERY